MDEAFDPECVFRAVALALAHFADKTGEQDKIMARAQANYDFIDPFALDDTPKFTFSLEGRK